MALYLDSCKESPDQGPKGGKFFPEKVFCSPSRISRLFFIFS
ncbi:hypothetical protein X474_13775 [Dethiosulfatarculus sandiegensis]|uniref:Uncharacterized protein n=1 Tax=Dethiosulfatarculus sandiegensis TaxID=1429043 RepID=A0A0D2JVG1_9BACT|nr:hypothetical protein X474_13775 [Dethiosulfatarculus sandiegensis]